MRSIVKTFLAPLSSIILLMLCNGFYMTFLSMRLNIGGFPESIIGYVHSAYYAGLLIGAVNVEKLIRRIGHIRAFSTFASLQTVTILLQGMFIVPVLWIITRFIAGICLAGMFVVIQSWMLNKSDVAMRGRILSCYMLAMYAAQAVSQFILDIIDPWTLAPFFVACMFCSLSLMPLTMTYSKSPELYEPGSKSIIDMFRTSPFGFASCILAGCILSSIYSFVPTFAQDMGISVSSIMSITITGGFILQWPIGKLSDIFDRRKVMIAVSTIAMIPCLVIVLTTSYPLVVLICSFILGGLCFTIYPLGVTQVCARLQTRDITAATGVLWLAYGIGSVLGPLVSSVFMEEISPLALYAYIALVSMVIAITGLLSIFIKRKPALGMEQGGYVTLSQVPPVIVKVENEK